MKKSNKVLAMILSVIMVCAMVISLTACNGGNNGGEGGKTGGGDKTPAEKLAAAQTSWNDAKGAKTANDEISVKLSVPLSSGTAVDLTVEASMTRKYNGSEVSEVSGKVTSVKVEGLGGILSGISGIVPSFDLNKIIKKTGKDSYGKYYETDDGKLYVEVDEDTGEEIAYYYRGREEEAFEDTANVPFKYVKLLDASNNIDLSSDDGLVYGLFTVEDKAFSAEYALNVLGMSMDGQAEVDPDLVDMDDIKELMDEFELDIDLDSIALFDLTKGSNVTEKNGNLTTKINFAVAVSDMIAQLDQFYTEFMAGRMDGDLVDVYNGFADEDVDVADFAEKVDPIRSLIKAFAEGLFGKNKSLSEMLFNLLAFEESNVTVKTKNDKITSVSGSQEASLTITQKLVNDVIDAIDEKELINEGDLRGMELKLSDTMALGVGDMIDFATGMLINKTSKSCVITLTVDYTTTLSYK